MSRRSPEAGATPRARLKGGLDDHHDLLQILVDRIIGATLPQAIARRGRRAQYAAKLASGVFGLPEAQELRQLRDVLSPKGEKAPRQQSSSRRRSHARGRSRSVRRRSARWSAPIGSSAAGIRTTSEGAVSRSRPPPGSPPGVSGGLEYRRGAHETQHSRGVGQPMGQSHGPRLSAVASSGEGGGRLEEQSCQSRPLAPHTDETEDPRSLTRTPLSVES